jgi:tRNA (guanosine-2'-O-)-methyltransferase
VRTIHSKTQVRKLNAGALAEHAPLREIAFWLQDWHDAYNVGGLFRVADALGAKEIVMSAGTPVPPNPMIPVTSLGAHRRVPFTHFEAHPEAGQYLREQGYALVAVELAEGAVSYIDFKWPERVALVLGNEQKGVYGKVMKDVDAAVFIPMAGKGRSLNVHVAAAIVGFDLMYRGV